MDSILNVHSSFRQDLILNDQAGFFMLYTYNADMFVVATLFGFV